MQDRPPDLESIASLQKICDRAGAAILQHYHSADAGEHSAKHDASPLTAADLAAHDIIVAGLEPLALPVLSEESDAATMQQRHNWQRYWLVDPLDGTREFLERTGEFTINIALIENGQPTLGVIAVPALGEFYLGLPGEGAWLQDAEGWRPIRARSLQANQPLAVYTSRRHRGGQLDACLASLEQQGYRVKRHHIGSALKFCQLARGEGDLYPRFAPCCEWDTAAGQALLEGAGGAVLDLQGQPLQYNQQQSLYSPHFFAIAEPASPLAASLLDR